MRLIKINQKGIGLVETLAALSITIIVVTSLVSLSLFTLRTSLNSRLMLQGTKIASQEIELVRAARDSLASWDDDFIAALNAAGCFGGSCYMTANLVVMPGYYDTSPGSPENINKRFTVEDRSGGDFSVIRVKVTVSWVVGGQTKYAYNYTDLSNWREL